MTEKLGFKQPKWIVRHAPELGTWKYILLHEDEFGTYKDQFHIESEYKAKHLAKHLNNTNYECDYEDN